jgi:hypothetical protein
LAGQVIVVWGAIGEELEDSGVSKKSKRCG